MTEKQKTPSKWKPAAVPTDDTQATEAEIKLEVADKKDIKNSPAPLTAEPIIDVNKEQEYEYVGFKIRRDLKEKIVAYHKLSGKTLKHIHNEIVEFFFNKQEK